MFVKTINTMDRFLIQTLVNIGFNEKESRVLLASFSLGKATAGDIAKRAELKRAIVYVILEDLSKQGYMTHLPTRGVKTYQALPPEKLLQMRQQQVENFRFMLPLMLNRQGSASNIEFYDTLDGILSVCHTFGRAKRARYFSNYASIKQAHGMAVMKKWAASAHDQKQKTRVQQILVENPDGQEFTQMLKGSKTWKWRFLERDIVPFIDFAVVDDSVAITNFNPLYIVVIRSKEVAQTFGYLFDQTWDRCTPNTQKKKQG